MKQMTTALWAIILRQYIGQEYRWISERVWMVQNIWPSLEHSGLSGHKQSPPGLCYPGDHTVDWREMNNDNHIREEREFNSWLLLTSK
jgi:hypothetical protein